MLRSGKRREKMHAAIQHRRHVIIVAGLITLVGVNLRTVVLGVPPVLPLIQHDLALTYTATGLLTSLPVLVMAAGAVPAGLLAGRWGARRSVGLGLALLAAGAALRAVWPAAVPLYLFTLVLSAGIAIGQTAVPVLARQWFPTRIGLVSALYSDGLILGETVAAGATVPLMRALLGRTAWSATFVLWSVPVAVTLALWLLLAPEAPPLSPRVNGRDSLQPAPAGSASGRAPVPGARPSVSAWRLGMLIGASSLIFFGMNGWIASYNVALHRTTLTPVALLALNAAQLPVSFAITPFAQQLAGRRWPFVTAGTLCVIATVGWLGGPAPAEPFWAAVLGGSSAFVFVLGIALPPLLAARGQVARLTGTTLMLSYGVAFLGPLVGGALWDVFRAPALAFVPVGAAGLLLITLGLRLPPHARFGLVHEPGELLAGEPPAAPPTAGPR